MTSLEKLEFFEQVIIAIIAVIQILSFIRTRRKIREFDCSMATISNIEIVELVLSKRQIDGFTTSDNIFEIAQNNAYDNNGELEFDEEQIDDTKIKIRLLQSNSKDSDVFNTILNSINKYLLRNRHSVADFSLIKDMVERHTDTLEGEINLTLSTPLYLGLMGTMFGIVVGIFSMSGIIGNLNDAESLTSGVSVLLSSVKIAMLVSLLGLILTIINSAIIFKDSKSKLENKKNDFYTFIQVELLPSLNQGMEATFSALQRNLFSFNEKFDSNLERLSTVFDKNYDAILTQKNLMEQMDNANVAEIAKYNIKVLKELNTSLVSFDKFNVMFSNVNSYLANSYKLTEQSNELLDRTGNFAQIADTISSNLKDNTKLIHFLMQNFEYLENHKSKIDEALVDVGFSIKDTFAQLNNSLKQASESLGDEAVDRNVNSRKVFEEFSNDLKNSFEQQVEVLRIVMEEKKSSLDYLKHLETLLTEVRSLKGEGKTPQYFSEQIGLLQSGIYSTNETLKRIELDAKKPFYKKLFTQREA